MGSACSGNKREMIYASADLEEGAMVEVEVHGKQLLLIRKEGEVRGLSGRCTHYGAPLVKGVLGKTTVTCPFHGACFNIDTGDIEDFPGLSSLVKYEVVEDGGGIYLSLRSELTETTKNGPDDSGLDTKVVVVGGGAAGHTAIQTLRKGMFKGKIVLLSSEDVLPYDRPKLSKKLDASAADLELVGSAWYAEAEVEVQLGVEVVQVLSQEKQVLTSTGDKISYDKLLMATGGTPRKLGVEGEDLAGVCNLRAPSDANYIHEHAKERNVVIVGGSFIGMEVAAVLVGICKTVTVIDRNKVSFQSSLGEKVGTILQQLHIDKGVQFEMESNIRQFVGTEEGNVRGVILQSGKEIEADLVLVGAGVTPNTGSLKQISGILDARGIIPVDEFMKTSEENIYAAGDIVRFPLLTYGGEQVNIGHWGLAMYMGKVAALSILGRPEPAKTVPFFWTVQFGKSVRFAGTAAECDEVVVDEKEPGTFLALYAKDGLVRGVATLGRDPVAAYFKNMVMSGRFMKLDEAFECLKTMPKIN